MSAARLRARLGEELAPELCAWLDEACSLQGDRLLGAFVGALRRVGREQLAPFELEGPSGVLQARSWSRGLAARVAILVGSQKHATGELFRRAFREGDSGEKLAVILALPLVEQGEVLLELALDAGRTNELDLFSALACHNPYPARHYPELELNKLVMKAAFLGLDLAEIVGLEARANPELARMGMEFVDERQAAGRGVLPSIWLTMAKQPPPGAVARMLGALNSAVAGERLGAARALRLTTDPRVGSFLRERQGIEKDEEVRAALRQDPRSASGLEGEPA